jgi:quercetin dioxygenase-like cupin family protein
MVEYAPHPLVLPAPHGLMWRRSLRRHRPTGAEAHQELVVLLGLEGSAQYLVDGLVYALRRGSLLWAMAGQQHVLLSETAGFDMRVVLVADAALPEHRSGLPPLRGPDLPPRQLVDSAPSRNWNRSPMHKRQPQAWPPGMQGCSGGCPGPEPCGTRCRMAGGARCTPLSTRQHGFGGMTPRAGCHRSRKRSDCRLDAWGGGSAPTLGTALQTTEPTKNLPALRPCAPKPRTKTGP